MWQGDKFFNRCSNSGKGRIYPNASIEEVFAELGIVPDFESNDPTLPLTFLHRTLPDGEIYFVANQGNNTINFNSAH